MAKKLLTEKEKHDIALELEGIANDFRKPMTKQQLDVRTELIEELREAVTRGGKNGK